jgi:hypothetical protein
MMAEQKQCPDCAADWSHGQTCTDHFHTLGYWELEHQLYDVHHLMVLAYHLQHPHLYSPEGLKGALGLLVQFVEQGATTQAIRQQNQMVMDSGNRKFKITGTAEAYGRYAHPVAWTMTAADVTGGGMEHFYANVWAWAASILRALRESGNLVN